MRDHLYYAPANFPGDFDVIQDPLQYRHATPDIDTLKKTLKDDNKAEPLLAARRWETPRCVLYWFLLAYSALLIGLALSPRLGEKLAACQASLPCIGEQLEQLFAGLLDILQGLFDNLTNSLFGQQWLAVVVMLFAIPVFWLRHYARKEKKRESRWIKWRCPLGLILTVYWGALLWGALFGQWRLPEMSAWTSPLEKLQQLGALLFNFPQSLIANLFHTVIDRPVFAFFLVIAGIVLFLLRTRFHTAMRDAAGCFWRRAWPPDQGRTARSRADRCRRRGSASSRPRDCR